jgi:hypothetical protein
MSRLLRLQQLSCVHISLQCPATLFLPCAEPVVRQGLVGQVFVPFVKPVVRRGLSRRILPFVELDIRWRFSDSPRRQASPSAPPIPLQAWQVRAQSRHHANSWFFLFLPFLPETRAIHASAFVPSTAGADQGSGADTIALCASAMSSL